MRVINESEQQAREQAASTHYTSFKPASMPTTQNFIQKQASGTQGVISSTDSYHKGVTNSTGPMPGGRAQTTNKDARTGEFTLDSSQPHLSNGITADINNQMFNYSSDNNLHERRPGTSGNVMN
jgi:hypothetical protein|mmetsp:Transcript_41406/g.54485  ORF Transcript_41406/g.54485 Transcript_41406/m.54485 type:complete len:124 (-) Transcript_41406:5141-5512(-)